MRIDASHDWFTIFGFRSRSHVCLFRSAFIKLVEKPLQKQCQRGTIYAYSLVVIAATDTSVYLTTTLSPPFLHGDFDYNVP